MLEASPSSCMEPCKSLTPLGLHLQQASSPQPQSVLLHKAMHVPDSLRPPSPASPIPPWPRSQPRWPRTAPPRLCTASVSAPDRCQLPSASVYPPARSHAHPRLPSASVSSKPDSASASVPTASASNCSPSASYGLCLRSRPLPAPLSLGPSSCMEPCTFPTPLGLHLQQARFCLGLGPNHVSLELLPLGLVRPPSPLPTAASSPQPRSILLHGTMHFPDSPRPPSPASQLPSASVHPPAWSHARPRLPSASVSSKPDSASASYGLRLQQARLHLGLGLDCLGLDCCPLGLAFRLFLSQACAFEPMEPCTCTWASFFP